MSITRRDFIKWSAAAGAWMYVSGATGAGRFLERAVAAVPGGTLAPESITPFVTPLLVPPVMPKARTLGRKNRPIDYYEISMRQFSQQILPAGLPATTVWGYGAVKAQSKRGLRVHHAPSLTIEAQWNRPVRVKWINDLRDAAGDYLPHLLPVDPTLHWANPGGGTSHRDMRPHFAETPGPYTGPVPIVTHVHGAVGVADDSDGYAEAWYLPDAKNIPPTFASVGTWYDFFKGKAALAYRTNWGPGFATFQYPNKNRASTIWYHDHALGMTRLNVYAGPAGFYIVRGGPGSRVLDSRTRGAARLPGPAPKANDAFPSKKTYFEIPIAIQDRAFNADGSLFYPSSREFFDGITGPFIPETDVSPIWNPEFFGNTIIVNGNTWPFHVVQQRRYRLRVLNGCQSRFLILDFSRIPGVEVWQIGNEGGFLVAPMNLTADNANQLLMGLAERADLIVDFGNVPVGNYVLGNGGPDEPFKGFNPDGTLADGEGGRLEPADPASTGRIMEFRVVPRTAADPTTPPRFMALPAIAPLPTPSITRRLAMLEEMSMSFEDAPVEARLGTVTFDESGNGVCVSRPWMAPVSENPAVGAVEVWELYNTTADAHPMHVHEVVFEVVNRQEITVTEVAEDAGIRVRLVPDTVMPREPWERGLKDTVVAYPGQVTRIKARFATPGQFTWHCHIVEHEDNEMMRPYRIGPVQEGEPEPMM